jgi:hypothetical protein
MQATFDERSFSKIVENSTLSSSDSSGFLRFLENQVLTAIQPFENVLLVQHLSPIIFSFIRSLSTNQKLLQHSHESTTSFSIEFKSARS